MRKIAGAFCRVVGWIGLVFAFLLASSLLLRQSAAKPATLGIVNLATTMAGIVLTVRLARLAIRQGIWRLRNRLLAAYLFMAVVPVVLIATLALVAAIAIASQLAVYLVTSELDRRIQGLDQLARSIAARKTVERRIDPVFLESYPGIAVVVREGTRIERLPAGAIVPDQVAGWATTRGVVTRGSDAYLWSYQKTAAGDVIALVPLTREYLGDLVPHLGLVGFGRPGSQNMMAQGTVAGEVPASRFSPPFDYLDPPVTWFAGIPMVDWNDPSRQPQVLTLAVRSRPTALADVMFHPQADLAQGILFTGLVVLALLFVLVELVALWQGVRLTRTMTLAVHRLYQGTQRASVGDFSHRIPVKGNDQLAELSHSFNRMTENVERLLVVSREKERLQSEIDIASEVQLRLYPRAALQTAGLRVFGMCQPARVVSGDYFDYEGLGGAQVMMAFGDVAGKGISAALLMASLQSSLRTQMNDAGQGVARMVARVNGQLHSSTTPETFATFFAGIFDEASGVFTYSNAGHLPPLLIRNGRVQSLDVNGMVVGAFSFAEYTESRVQLMSGDLLVLFSDGVSEPENAYEEMFGEQRLAELVARHAHLSEAEIIARIFAAVREWTAAEEMPDDMTLLLARRL
jgi:phosphoserine phosphatase RsbU/P